MNFRAKIISLFLFLVLCPLPLLFSQDEEESTPQKNTKGAKGFHMGISIGSLWANKYTASFYDGWGYDENGKRNNDFISSFMYRRIVIDYGGGNGQPDQIAQALGVDPTANPKEWSFDQSDMPLNMKYTAAFMIGAQLNYGFTKKDAVLVNVNVCKLTLSGNFTIIVTNPLIGPQQPGYEDIKTFSITGGEQRLMLQLGYRRILGDTEESVVNFFIEGGATLNMTKYLRNQITINNFNIDLAYYYTQPNYPTYRARYLKGTGFGAFAGFGLTLTANPKWTLDLFYNPTYEKINLGEEPKLALQNAIGLRAFYNL